MQVKFYVNEDNLLVLNGMIIPKGNIIIDSEDDGAIDFKWASNGVSVFGQQILIENILKSNGDNYASYADIYSTVKSFINPESSNWLTYKALLTQTGEDAPVARVLNQDEPDYLGDIDFIRIFPGHYKFPVENNLSIITIPNAINTDGFSGFIEIDNNIEFGFCHVITYSYYDASEVDNLLKKTPIEIKVRQRGSAPVLLSAETNTTGDKVILTFDKKMNIVPANDSNNGGGQYNGFAIVGSYLGGLLGSGNQKDNVIESMCDPILNGEIITIYYNPASLGYPGNSVESLDFGLLQPFENFPVTNNVPAPPQLIDAYTNTTGDKVTLVFDKDVQVILPNNGVWYNGMGSGCLVDDWLYFTGCLYPKLPPSTYPPIVDGNKITYDVEHDTPLDNATQLFINYVTHIGGDLITSLDGGILQPFTDFPVVNNVVAPE